MRIVGGLGLLAAVLALRPAPAAAMQLSVNTHFDQGWGIALLDKVAAAQAAGIRDSIGWGRIEQSRGVYMFAGQSGFAQLACARAMPMLLMITPRNRLYDGGYPVYSPEGRQALADYVRTLLDRYPCIAGIELGNEINIAALPGPILAGMPQSYLAMVKAVRDAIKPGHANVALLAGSTLFVATGYLERLFAAGLLPLVDGVAVHPYRSIPEQIPIELDRLRAAMARHGGEKPIWASEFGISYPDPAQTPAYALKTITLLSAANVHRADWYALLDEPGFPHMGLYAGKAPNPALDTFQLAARQLLPGGDAQRIDAGDPLTFVYRFGSGSYVLWGEGRPIQITGGGALDARGNPVALPSVIGSDPIVLPAEARFTFGPVPVRADSQIDSGGAPWHQYVVGPTGQTVPLHWIDWKQTSYIGSAAYANFKVMAGAVAVGGSPASRPSLRETYTSPVADRLRISSCFVPVGAAAVMVRISLAGKQLYAGPASATVQPPPLDVTLKPGDSLDFSYMSQAMGGANLIRRRIRLLATTDPAAALCPPGAAPE